MTYLERVAAGVDALELGRLADDELHELALEVLDEAARRRRVTS